MDVEKTLHAIAESQRRAELRANRADERADRADKRIDKIDKKLQATANLLNKGIQLFLDNRKDTNYKLHALIDAQMQTEAAMKKTDEAMKKTDEKFNRLLEILGRKTSNGHK